MVPTLHRYIKYRRLVEELVNYQLTGTGASKNDAVDVLAKKFRFWMTTLLRFPCITITTLTSPKNEGKKVPYDI